MCNPIKLIECMRTFQGEGPDSGRAMILARFKTCNNNCFFCDTAVQMRIAQEGQFTIPQIQGYLDDYRCGLLITGGEPTFSYHYLDTISLLSNLKYSIANVETNGYNLLKILDSKLFLNRPVKFIYSPKIFDEDTEHNAINLTEAILGHPQVYIKIPFMQTHPVLQYCEWLSDKISMTNGYGELDDKVWLMPIGSKAEDQKMNSSAVMDACENFKFNFTGRIHTMYEFI